MKNKLAATISLAAVMGAASSAQAADMPMTPQGIIQHVASNCMKGFNISPFDTPLEFAQSWNSAACKEAMDLSSAHMNYVLDTAFEEADANSITIIPTLDDYRLALEKVMKELGSDPETQEMHETIDFLAEMALDGFPTAKGILNKEMEDYAVKKYIDFNFNN